jgi:phage tail sheath gpL-like
MQVFGVINDFDSNDLLQNVDAIKDGTVVQRETNPSSRMGVRVPLACIENFRQGAAAIDQVA